jgi:putative ABC transport system permease protein
MGNLITVVRMVAQRSLGHWKLFTAMVVGAVLCAALMACVVLYSDAVRDLGLKHALETQPAFANDIRVSSTSQKFSGEAYSKLHTTTDQLMNQQVGGIRRAASHYGRSATFFPTAPGEAVTEDDNRPRAHFQFQDNLLDHVNIVDGKAPAPFTAGVADTQPPEIEVLLGRQTADAQGVKVGQEFDVEPHWRQVPPLRVKVVGIIAPKDPNDEVWFGNTDRFAVTTNNWPTLPFWVDEATLVQGIGGYLPDITGSLETYAFINEGSIDNTNADSVLGAIGGLKGTISAQLPITTVDTTLDTTISNYQQKLFFTRLPLFALMIQIVGIVLFYLVMVSTMVVERQTGEIALLKSRGAGTPQLMTVFLIEGLGITAFATILGPFVAAGAISLLGLTPPFEELSHGDLLSVHMTGLAFAMALGGGLLALLALLWPAYRACGLSITNYKQQISRPPRKSAFLRYYGDLILIAIGAFAFYQLRQKGSFVTVGLFG